MMVSISCPLQPCDHKKGTKLSDNQTKLISSRTKIAVTRNSSLFKNNALVDLKGVARERDVTCIIFCWLLRVENDSTLHAT